MKKKTTLVHYRNGMFFVNVLVKAFWGLNLMYFVLTIYDTPSTREMEY